MEKITPNALTQLIDTVYLPHEHVDTSTNIDNLKPIKDSQTDNKPATIELKEEAKLQYLGKNAKGVIILTDINLKNAPDDKKFLLKVMDAVKLTIEDIAIIHATPEAKNWTSQVKYSYVFDFGSNSSSAVLNNYEVTEIEGVKWIKADSLNKIENNVQLKKSLWGNLKLLFS